MAAEATASAVTLLGNLLIQKVEFLGDVSGQVRLLREELNRIQSFLKDANKKKAEDERVRTWIMDIREVAHDAVDAIEMYVFKVEITEWRLGSIMSLPINTSYRNKVGNEIKWIQARLKGTDESRQRYGIKDLGETSESPQQWQVEQLRRLDPGKKGEHLVDMEDDVEKVLQEFVLDNKRKELRIGVLHGIGGIGKSTLAREIYNHPDVTNRFECRVWVVVSSQFTPQETIKQIILELQKSEEEKKQTLEKFQRMEVGMKDVLYIQRNLTEMLHKQLEGKSYFIILDDVWEKEHLEYLITAFPNEQGKGSRLLITSRNDIRTNNNQYLHEMKALDDVKSKELLLKKANIDGSNGMDTIMAQILEKCGGLPLAISVVGGLLLGKQTSREWKDVLDEINDHLVREESSVSAILELSYQNLSPQLKPCFLCFAFFEEDATIPIKWLEDMWVSQGLIPHEENRAADKIARGYLNELINRSLIQVKDVWFDGRVKNCQIHDLIREVCLRKAKEEMSLEVVRGKEAVGSSSATATPYKARHRVVYGNNLVISKNQNKCIRSLFLLNVNYEDDYLSSVPTGFWKSFKLLQTLHLEGFAFRRLPESLGLLIGLKILRIVHTSDGYGVLFLPTCRLNKLKKLEVLTVENATVLMSNDDVALEIETLRHLDATLWKGFKIGNCKSIETIKFIDLEDWLEYSSEVIDNCPLRELGIVLYLKLSKRSDDKSSRVKALWEKMTNLVKLHLHFTYGSDLPLREVIPGHLNSLTTLAVSSLGVPISTTPKTRFPPNLSHLILTQCLLSDDEELKVLGNLPKLRYLALFECHVNSNYTSSTIVVLCNSFPCLEVLFLQNMWRLRDINIEEGGMPLLKELKICHCPDLQTLNLSQRDILISQVPKVVF